VKIGENFFLKMSTQTMLPLQLIGCSINIRIMRVQHEKVSIGVIDGGTLQVESGGSRLIEQEAGGVVWL
jgi:hypothetical protein